MEGLSPRLPNSTDHLGLHPLHHAESALAPNHFGKCRQIAQHPAGGGVVSGIGGHEQGADSALHVHRLHVPHRYHRNLRHRESADSGPAPTAPGTAATEQRFRAVRTLPSPCRLQPPVQARTTARAAIHQIHQVIRTQECPLQPPAQQPPTAGRLQTQRARRRVLPPQPWIRRPPAPPTGRIEPRQRRRRIEAEQHPLHLPRPQPRAALHARQLRFTQTELVVTERSAASQTESAQAVRSGEPQSGRHRVDPTDEGFPRERNWDNPKPPVKISIGHARRSQNPRRNASSPCRSDPMRSPPHPREMIFRRTSRPSLVPEGDRGR